MFRVLRTIVRRYSAKVFFLTKADQSIIKVVARSVGFPNFFVVEVEEGRGGMALFCLDGVDILIIDHINRFIHTQLKDDLSDEFWNATFVYGSPYQHSKNQFDKFICPCTHCYSTLGSIRGF